MIAVIYYYFRTLPLLLTFRVGFRKPSGTFRDAAFEAPTCGGDLCVKLVTQVGDKLKETWGDKSEHKSVMR